ncbi:type II toxin-antitoxin system PemK/MazF family toxin [Chroococcus sp. FPU101]|uniref:type II toxin-antitoxin system PemK/MazF family toxin n=1 Tax=Chroococcus sp. FPU101 TaxID=1974212 RepID=UPI001A8D9766|nr:type II toxin-antitoxin system PemK/MazF family toxin [Chroococcus sp. FPU101]GFE68521.1 transcriptional modulator of MazE/toxin, MazF [Chroococcus sp. FPU101]
MVKIEGRIPERGDIIRLQLDPRTGSEQSGYRPALVISPLIYNQISKLILVCPITSRKKGWPFEIELPEQMQTYGFILVDQIRTVDCNARKAIFIEKAPLDLINEVLGKLVTIVT